MYVYFQILGPPTLHNIGYIGFCYNIIKGNPKPTVNNLLDPGFFCDGSIFEFTYNQNRTTADGRYLIPDNTDANAIQSCSFIFSSSIINDLRSYTDSLKTHVDTDFTKWGASFSASADYHELKQRTEYGEYIFVSSEAECQAYGASIRDADSRLSEDFIFDVAHLPTTNSSLDEYLEFIRMRGTHIVTSLIMGGRFGVRSEFSTENYGYLSSGRTNIKATAGYSGYTLIGGSLPSEVKNQTQIFNDRRKGYDVYLAGYAPSVDKNGTAFEWARVVNESPLPLSYSLKELSQYLTPRYFPSDTKIATKKMLLENATREYCRRTALEPADCHQEFGPKKSTKIDFSFKNTIVNITKYFHSQYSENPKMRIVGSLVGEGKAGSPSVLMVDSSVVPRELITEPVGSPQNSTMFLRYKCPNNFYTVSDFLTAHLPPALPCIASQCLAQCSRRDAHFNQFDVNLIANGFFELGNSGDPSLLSFFRDPKIPHEGNEEDLYKCLTYKCLVTQ